MTSRARYRVEDGTSCVDLTVKHSRQLFDGRDPAPFRERDLDEDAEEYLLESVQEIPAKQPLRIVVTISEEPEPRLASEIILEAVRGHFVWKRDQVQHRVKAHLRRAQAFLLIGITALFAFLLAAELTTALPAGHLRQILREGFVITGWVAMWRPLEALFYDWWPLVASRRPINRILEADIVVRWAAPPAGGAQGPRHE